MSRILLAWELGGALGHISKLLIVARCLRQRGHDVLFAVKDVGTARLLLDDEDFGYVQSPLSLRQERVLREPAGFADILAGAGFAEPDVLQGLVRAWHNLFHIYRPDVVLSQYAPSAQLAARLAGLPCPRLNIGFECPPDVAPFPCFRPWLRLTKDQLLKKEESVLNSINSVCVRHGAPSFPVLQAALKSDITLLATLPELDHYGVRRGGRYTGPLFITDDGEETQWPEGGAFRIFVYLRGGPEAPSVLEALETSGASVVAFIPGIDGKLPDRFSNGQLRIYTSKVKLTPLLPEMDLAVTHANHGTVSAALLAGVPLLSIPTTIEQWMLSVNIERLGAGIGIKRVKVGEEFSSTLERLLTNDSYKENAKKLAMKYAGYDQGRVVERIANTIERLPNKHFRPECSEVRFIPSILRVQD
jgi:UDP:flavonoid glycosyltransferase YjiC (YdhE family)